jgi:hypothetical protein
VVPLKLVALLGLTITFLAVLVLILIFIDKLFLHYFDFSNLAIVVVLNTILNGIVLMSLGLIAIYIARIHEETL